MTAIGVIDAIGGNCSVWRLENMNVGSEWAVPCYAPFINLVLKEEPS